MHASKDFPDAIESVYPQARIQLSIVHQVRNSLKLMTWRDYKAVTAGLKTLYQAPSEAAAREQLTVFGAELDERYPQVRRSREANWANLSRLFDYPPEIRKVSYTTNAIESLNSMIRKATKNRKVFPADDSAMKVANLAICNVAKNWKNWKRPVRNWKAALNRFGIEFGDRVTDHL